MLKYQATKQSLKYQSHVKSKSAKHKVCAPHASLEATGSKILPMLEMERILNN